MSKDKKDHFAFGLTRDQWAALYDKADWVHLAATAAFEVATCEDARTSDRAEALAHLGDLVNSGHIPERLPNGQTIPELVVAVQRSVVTGVRAWSESTRESCHERILGVREMKNTIGQILRGQIGAGPDLKIENVPPELEAELEHIFGGKAPQGAN